jgi:flap endonuclease-1
MGIKGLNSFLRTACFKNIREISLYDLTGKTIVIDTSIYMYRFKRDDTLIEGIYQMISQFKYYNITPIFIFDGKPPEEKKQILQQRSILKQEAIHRYYEVKKELEKCVKSNDIERLQCEIQDLRKKTVRISKNDTENVKLLLQLSGTSYYECSGESDAICAYMVQSNMAYACLSEDTDMFVYGTLRVLRYLSLLKSTVVIYDINGMLSTLNLTIKDFRDICIVSGSDYNKSESINFNLSLNMFIKYIETECDEATSYSSWMIKKNHIKDETSFNRAIELFDISNIKLIDSSFVKSRENTDELKLFLEKFGFIFVNSKKHVNNNIK